MIPGVQMVLCLAVLTQTGELSLSSRLGQLDHAEYAIRQQATEQLMQEVQLTDEQLNELYQQAKTPEQRYRLEEIALHRCLKAWISQVKNYSNQPGSIGIHLSEVKPISQPLLESGGVMVQDTLPGMPAHEVLRAGDVIVEVNQQPLVAASDKLGVDSTFKNLIQAHRAGTTIEFKVIRDKQPIIVSLPTAPAPALGKLYDSKRVGSQSSITLSKLARDLWQKRMVELFKQPQPQNVKDSELSLNPISIQWHANASQ
ncbi:MAG: PDZ domain-containing protein [Phycisphaeraceae bacterium JB051]